MSTYSSYSISVCIHPSQSACQQGSILAALGRACSAKHEPSACLTLIAMPLIARACNDGLAVLRHFERTCAGGGRGQSCQHQCTHLERECPLHSRQKYHCPHPLGSQPCSWDGGFYLCVYHLPVVLIMPLHISRSRDSAIKAILRQ